MGDRLACAFPCLSLWYEPSWGVDYAMQNVSDVSVDVSDVSEVNATRPLVLATAK